MLTEGDARALKQTLIAKCYHFIDQRINTIQLAIAAAQESANDETKSSAGDKYETGRAMMQLEVENNAKQLAEAMKQRAVLDQLNAESQSATVQQGSLVITDQGNFFIAISVGLVQVNEQAITVVSAQSPVGLKMKDLKPGDGFTNAGRTYRIQEVK